MKIKYKYDDIKGFKVGNWVIILPEDEQYKTEAYKIAEIIPPAKLKVFYEGEHENYTYDIKECTPIAPNLPHITYLT